MSVCDKATFKDIYFKWNLPLQRFLMSKGLDLSKSSDLVQDTFMKLWSNCTKVEVEKVKSYLFTIARNLFIDHYRTEQTRLKLKLRSKNKSTFIDGQFRMEMSEFGEHLESAINSMTNASKEVFILNRFNDMTYKEIAEQLEISVKAVEKRMSKALKHLSEKRINLKR